MSIAKNKVLLVWDGTAEDDFAWEDLLTELQTLLNEKNPEGYWFAKVVNFGWRNMNGHQEFQTTDARTFLRKILPDTDCHFNIFDYKKNGLAIQNYHHDSPTGKEWYYITPRKPKEE